eukprot:UN27825
MNKQISHRHALYVRKSGKIKVGKLLRGQLKKAIKKSGYKRSEITHIVSHSCTGWTMPGFTAQLINELGLNDTCERIETNFMGCFGSFTLLKIARALVQADQSNVVLVVANEASKLQGCFDEKWDKDISESCKHRCFGWMLFADGASSYVVSNRGIIKMCLDGGGMVPNSVADMVYLPRWNNYICQLSRDVPTKTAASIFQFLKTLPHKSLQFCIHPGGKKIVDMIKDHIEGYGIEPTGVQDAYDTLREHGNCSSATVGFVIERVLEKNYNKDNFFICGFGPGLTADWILGTRSNNKAPTKTYPSRKAYISAIGTSVPKNK